MSPSPSGEQIEIAFADQCATVVEVGAGIRTFSAEGRQLLDGYGADEPIRSGRGQVLIPWPNRLEDGSYEFDGQRHQLPLTEPERGDAIHGLVREERWTVGEREPHRVVMEHVLEPRPGYPFTLSLAIEYALSERGLSVRTTATNTGSDSCPFASGQHPYLTLGTPSVDSLVLSAPGGRSCSRTNGASRAEESRSTARRTTSGVRGRSARRSSTMRSRTSCAARTDVRASSCGIPRSRAGLSLWVDESYRYLQLFTGDPLPDVSRRSLAVEPMTCPPNAFRTGEDLVRLEPGSELRERLGDRPVLSQGLAWLLSDFIPLG